MKIKENVNVSALAGGVTSLLAVVGALTATDSVGRLQRNEPEALTAAVTVVLLGAVMLVVAGLPVTSGRSEIFATLVGTGLTVIGAGWAIGGAILTAGERERPELQMAIDAEGPLLDGHVKAANLASDRRLAVSVEGLTGIPAESATWAGTSLARFFVGPDGDGKIDLPVKVAVSGGYKALAVKAWTDEEGACPDAASGEAAEQDDDTVGTSCVVLPMPAPATTPAAPKRATPTVRLTWAGARRTRVRVRVRAPKSEARVAVLTAAARRGTTRQLLRVVHRTDGKAFRTDVALRVPVRVARLCVRVHLLRKGEKVPRRLKSCAAARAQRAGAMGAVLRRTAT